MNEWKTDYLKNHVIQSNESELSLKATKFYGKYFYKVNKEMMSLKKLCSAKNARHEPHMVLELITMMGDDCDISVSRNHRSLHTFCLTEYFSKKFDTNVSPYDIQREMDRLFARDRAIKFVMGAAAFFFVYIIVLIILFC